MNSNLKTIANSYAEECCSDAIYPAHLFKAVLHKETGLIHFLETDLGKDYYYLLDWADVQMQLSPRAARPMRDLDYSDESQAVMQEAETYQLKFGLDECTAVCVLASLVTPGVGFSFDQLKTLPLTPSDISAKMGAGTSVEAPYIKTELSKALAEFLFGDESALLRFDMSEFKEEHSVAPCSSAISSSRSDWRSSLPRRHRALSVTSCGQKGPSSRWTSPSTSGSARLLTPPSP